MKGSDAPIVVTLHLDRCLGCGACFDVAPGLYEALYEARVIRVDGDRPERQQQARDATVACEAGALSIRESGNA